MHGRTCLEVDGIHDFGLGWSDSSWDLCFFLYFRQSKAAEFDLLFHVSRKIWSRPSWTLGSSIFDVSYTGHN